MKRERERDYLHRRDVFYIVLWYHILCYVVSEYIVLDVIVQCMCMCEHIHAMCVHTYIYIYMYTYIYIEREIEGQLYLSLHILMYIYIYMYVWQIPRPASTKNAKVYNLYVRIETNTYPINRTKHRGYMKRSYPALRQEKTYYAFSARFGV